VITRLGATPGVDPATIHALRGDLGLDRSIVAQYVDWVGGLLRGDFGSSYFSQYSVTELISQRIGATLELTIVSVVLALLLAVPAAILCALRPRGAFDRVVTALSSFGLAFPPFVAGIFLLLIFSVKLRWLPARGYVSFADDPVENIRRMILPAATLAIVAAPLVLRYLRAALIEALDAPYIRTAQGKGVPRRRVVIDHALPNALIPGLTMVGLIVGYTLGGVVLIEYVFGFSGLGSLAVEAAFKRDYAVLQSVVLLISAMFILTSLAIDLLARVLDPRLRAGVADV
jgi:peptide/nickel transport system permease protein